MHLTKYILHKILKMCDVTNYYKHRHDGRCSGKIFLTVDGGNAKFSSEILSHKIYLPISKLKIYWIV